MAKTILNFHFDYFTPSLRYPTRVHSLPLSNGFQVATGKQTRDVSVFAESAADMKIPET